MGGKDGCGGVRTFLLLMLLILIILLMLIELIILIMFMLVGLVELRIMPYMAILSLYLSVPMCLSWLPYRGLLSSRVLHWRVNAGLLLLLCILQYTISLANQNTLIH